MKWAVRIIIAVVLGAVINVGVAWGCALWSGWSLTQEWDDLDALPLTMRSLIRDEWLPAVDPEPGVNFGVFGAKYNGFGVNNDEVMITRYTYFGHSVRNHVIWHITAGWPVRTLACSSLPYEKDLEERESDSISPSAFLRPVIREGVFSWKKVPLKLPLTPLWNGAAVNTAFYAAVFLLLIWGPSTLRRVIRVRAGRCTACGYDRRGLAAASAPCPECGAADATPINARV